MFTIKEVEKVMKELKSNPGHFISEAHLQTTFAMQAYKLYKNKFSYYLEYPINNGNNSKTGEADLVIIDTETKEKTHIEFKRKTKNGSGKNKVVMQTVDGINFTPTSMLAQDLGRYDCWSDIERIEEQISERNCKNGFFIFITNDDLYRNSAGTKTFGYDFSMMDGLHKAGRKKWKTPVNIKSIGKRRNKAINIKNDYTFKYVDFIVGNGKYNKTWLLIVKI